MWDLARRAWNKRIWKYVTAFRSLQRWNLVSCVVVLKEKWSSGR